MWCQVAVADRRHGNDRPPESEWNRRESSAIGWTAGGLLQVLGVVDKRRENDQSDEQKEDEQAKLVSAGTECLDENFQSGRMTS